MYPEKIKPEDNTTPILDQETIETLVELTDSNRKNRTIVEGT
jgi:hypothetical protein